MEFVFSILWMSLILPVKFMSLKSNSSAQSLSTFAIYAGWWFEGFKSLSMLYSKHCHQYFEY